MLQSARESDLASAGGTKCKQSHHPQHQTGVHASHAMQKVPGYDDEGSRKPDPMHTIGNEVTAVTVMAQGGTAAIYSVARLPEAAKWEVSLNKRWEELLNPYLHGIYMQPTCTCFMHALHCWMVNPVCAFTTLT